MPRQLRAIRDAAWEKYQAPILSKRKELLQLLDQLAADAPDPASISQLSHRLKAQPRPIFKDLIVAAHQALFEMRDAQGDVFKNLQQWVRSVDQQLTVDYGSHLYSESTEAVSKVPLVEAKYGADAKRLNGFEILNACFDAALARDPRVHAFGEDVGQLGAVNQGFKDLQRKHGELRVADTGIRECTILGQAIGMALRGLRPIAEIQYLDYLLYALQIMSDDLATLQWRTRGGQKAPVIIRTRGHRLEGVWHSGSPMGGIINFIAWYAYSGSPQYDAGGRFL